jgi:hypothetical protein
MNDHELDRLLRSARVPEREADYFADFPRQVRLRLSGNPPAVQRPRRPWLAWALTVATACLVIGFAFGHWRGRRAIASGNGLLQNPKLISEVCALFPNRVRAIVQDESGLRLELADEANLPESAPLWVRIRQGGRTESFVTFSGQQIKVAGQQVTVLAGNQGKVLLVGDRFAWSTDEPGSPPGQFDIAARTLDTLAAK